MKKNRKIAAICVLAAVICGLIACKDAYSVDVISGVDHDKEEITESVVQEDTVKNEEMDQTEPVVTKPLEAEIPVTEEAEGVPEEEDSEIPELTEADPIQCEPTSPSAPSKELIDSYGYAEDGSSLLSFDIRPGEVVDGGDHYEVTAIYGQAIEAPGNLEMGDSVTLVFNEITGEEKTLTRKENGSLYDAEGMEYYYHPTEDGSPVVLYWWSDDRVDKPICEGKLYIRKFATDEVVIAETSEFITEERLENGAWYNGVYFDEQGYVVRLCFVGD